MSYTFYLGGIQLPIPPSKLNTKISNNNKVINLINEGDVNVIKSPGLTEINFECCLPNNKYPFATYTDGYKDASYYLEQLELLKTSKQPFQFIVIRLKPNGEYLFDTNIKVTLEDYTIEEDVGNGIDVNVSVNLKQYKSYATKVIKVDNTTGKATITTTRQNKPIPSTYTVLSGDNLWTICKKVLGSDEKVYDLMVLNCITDPFNLEVGQVIKIG